MTLLRAALHYAATGKHIMPTWPRDRRPLLSGGIENATTDEETIRERWARSPHSNIAMAPGRSGLLVVTVEGTEGGNAAAWLGVLGVRTMRINAGDSLMLLFQRAPFEVTTRQLAPNVGVCCDTGFVLLPPSILPGVRYTWNGTRTIAELPEVAVEHLRRRPLPRSHADRHVADTTPVWGGIARAR